MARAQLEHSIERDEWEPLVAGRRLRFLEMSNAELSRYAAHLEAKYERAVTVMETQPTLSLDKVAEIVIEHEDAFFEWVCNLHARPGETVDTEWIRVELTTGMRRRLLANIDALNHIETSAGNWKGLRQEAIERRLGWTLPTSLEPVTDSTPESSGLIGPHDKP